MPEIWNLRIEEVSNNISLNFDLKLPEGFTDEEEVNFIDELNYWGLNFELCNTQKINFWEDNPFPNAVGPDKNQYEQNLCTNGAEFVGFASTYQGQLAEPRFPFCKIEKFSQIPKVKISKVDDFTLSINAPLWRVSRYLCGYTFDEEILNDRVQLDPMFSIDSYDRWNDREFPSDGSWWIVFDKIDLNLPFYGEKCEMTLSFIEYSSLKRTNSQYNNLKNIPRNSYIYKGCDFRVLSWMKYAEENQLIIGNSSDGIYFKVPDSEMVSGDEFAVAIKSNIKKTWKGEFYPGNSISTSSNSVNYYDNPDDPDGLKLFQSYNISLNLAPGYEIQR